MGTIKFKCVIRRQLETIQLYSSAAAHVYTLKINIRPRPQLGPFKFAFARGPQLRPLKLTFFRGPTGTNKIYMHSRPQLETLKFTFVRGAHF